MTKILVIDDDDLVRSMICTSLKKEKFDVVEARNGNEGVEKAKAEKPDLVITDILMPNKEGIETIMDLHALDSKVKIIAMSGGGSSKNMSFLEMAKKVGAQHVLNKPFKSSTLLGAVNSLLET